MSCTISAAARDVPVDNADQFDRTALWVSAVDSFSTALWDNADQFDRTDPEGSAERVGLVRPHIELL